MVLEDVLPVADSQQDAPADSPDKGGGKEKGTGKEKDDLGEARAEIARLRKSNEQLTESERYWAQRASGAAGDGDDEDGAGGKAKASAEPDDDDEDLDDPGKFVDELSAKGPRAIQKWLKREGYVTRSEAEDLAVKKAGEAVSVARAGLTQDAELMQRFPDLKNAESELFEATGKAYREMVARDPAMKKSPGALFAAAELATERMKAQGRDATGGADDRERERQARVRAQQGDRGRRTAAAMDERADDSMGPEAKHIAAAMGVSDADYMSERSKLRGRD